MKKQILLLGVFALFLRVSAQENLSVRKNELSLNVSSFITNYIGFGGNAGITNNPYILGYKRIFNNKKALRLGVNFTSNNNNTRVNAQQPRNYNSTYNLDLRAGFEWRKNLSSKFSWFYGVDFATGINETKNTNSQQFFDGWQQVEVLNISSNKTESFGGGPIAGIQLNITPRISLFTEGRAYVRYAESEQYVRWEDVTDGLRSRFPNVFDERSNTDFFSDFSLVLPLDVFIAIKF